MVHPPAQTLESRIEVLASEKFLAYGIVCLLIAAVPWAVFFRPQPLAFYPWTLFELWPKSPLPLFFGATLGLGVLLAVLGLLRRFDARVRAIVAFVGAAAWVALLAHLVDLLVRAAFHEGTPPSVFGARPIVLGLAMLGLASGAELRMARAASRAARALLLASAAAILVVLFVPDETLGGLPPAAALAKLMVSLRGDIALAGILSSAYILVLLPVAVAGGVAAIRGPRDGAVGPATTKALRFVSGFAVSFVPGIVAIFAAGYLAGGVLALVLVLAAAILRASQRVLVTGVCAVVSLAQTRKPR
jgi:hypothetical protein